MTSSELGLFPAYDSEAVRLHVFLQAKKAGSINISALAQRALHDGAAAQSLHIAEREGSNVSAAFAKATAGQVVRRENEARLCRMKRSCGS